MVATFVGAEDTLVSGSKRTKWRFPKIRGPFLGVPMRKDHCICESMPPFMETPKAHKKGPCLELEASR